MSVSRGVPSCRTIATSSRGPGGPSAGRKRTLPRNRPRADAAVDLDAALDPLDLLAALAGGAVDDPTAPDAAPARARGRSAYAPDLRDRGRVRVDRQVQSPASGRATVT